MKALLLSWILLTPVLSAESLAAPVVTGYSLNCQYKPRTDGPWKDSGKVIPSSDEKGLHLKFYSDERGAGMDDVETTNTDHENRVEGRCLGSIDLKNNKPFKIKDFTFVVTSAALGTNDGFIELQAKGNTLITGTETKDEFGKKWTVRKPELDRWLNEQDSVKKAKVYPFTTQIESNTLCHNQLTLRFEDLRAVSVRGTQVQDDDERTSIFIDELSLVLEPC